MNNGSWSRSYVVGGNFLAVLVLLGAPPARANIGPRWWGNYGSEPLGGLEAVAITRERLAIDLRPLALTQPAGVEATYHLYNSGAARRLDLLFVAGSDEVADFEVRLGERLLESRPVPRDELLRRWNEMPASWKPPREMPGIDQPTTYYTPIRAPHEGIALLAFAVNLPSGPSTLQVRYRTRIAGSAEGSYPTTTWQLPYVMAPARAWGSFGDLEVVVHLPDGWHHACAPPLEREGDVLRGSFKGLPADTLVVATRMPVGPTYYRGNYLYGSLFAAVTLSGGVLCGAIGRRLGWWLSRRQNWGPTALRLGVALPALLLGVLWGALILAALFLSRSGVRANLGTQEGPYFHEQLMLPTCGAFLLALTAVPLGGVLAWGLASSTLRKARESAGLVNY